MCLNQTFPMKVIRKPKRGTKGVLRHTNPTSNSVFLTGDGKVDLVCGNCGAVLIKSSFPCAAPVPVLLCPICNRYNEKYEYDELECSCRIKDKTGE